MSAEFDYGWDSDDTVRYYEAFCARHSRYELANRSLVKLSGIRPGMNVLDIGAGTGRTAESALPFLGDGRILCVEPADAMRRIGSGRLSDTRIRWAAELPASGDQFDRVLWGAGIWQAFPLDSLLSGVARLLRTGGAFCFNIPSLYLGIPNEAGGGPDPLLLELPARLMSPNPPPVTEGAPLPGAEGIDNALISAGMNPVRSAFRIRVSQECKRDWLKIPVMTNRMMPELSADERAERIDAAYESLPRESWVWEGWHIWNAVRNGSDG